MISKVFVDQPVLQRVEIFVATSPIMLSNLVLVFTTALALALALPQVDLATGKSKCKPFSGNFTIDQYQLYPENSDFDFKSCLLYIR